MLWRAVHVALTLWFLATSLLLLRVPAAGAMPVPVFPGLQAVRTWGRGDPYPGQVIGYLRDGRPIRRVAGGAVPVQYASNSASFTSGTTGTLTVTFGNNVADGDCVIALITVYCVNATSTSPTVSSVTSNSAPDNWAQIEFGQQNPIKEMDQEFWADIGSAGGFDAVDVDVTFNATNSSSSGGCIIAECYELPPVSAVDSTETGGFSNTTTTDTGTTSWGPLDNYQASTYPNEVWIGFTSLTDASTSTSTVAVTSGNGWTAETTVGGTFDMTSSSRHIYSQSAWQVVAAAGQDGTWEGTSSATQAAQGLFIVGLALASGVPRPFIVNQAVKRAAYW